MPGGGSGYYGVEGEKRVKPLRWTSPALQALVERDIDQAEVERTIAVPELLVIDPPRRMQRRRISAASTSARSWAPGSRPS